MKNQLCTICYEEFEESKMKSLGKCGHSFCSSCFNSFFKALVEENNIHLLQCPESACGSKPTKKEIENILNKMSFDKYVKFQRNTGVAQNQNQIFCSTADCQSILETGLFSADVCCPTCGKSTCSECKQASHGKKSCERNLRDQYGEWVASENVHKCPKCKCQIEKNGGCPQMSCSNCRHRWCWFCGFAIDCMGEYPHFFCEFFLMILEKKYSLVQKVILYGLFLILSLVGPILLSVALVVILALGIVYFFLMILFGYDAADSGLGNVVLSIFRKTFQLIGFFVMVTAGLLLVTIIIPIFLALAYIALVIILVSATFQWLLKSRKSIMGTRDLTEPLIMSNREILV